MKKNDEQVSNNLAFKVLGRRGERVLRQVELRQNEEVRKEGKVILKEVEELRDRGMFHQRGEKRGYRSPGSSPPAGRRVGGRWVENGKN